MSNETPMMHPAEKAEFERLLGHSLTNEEAQELRRDKAAWDMAEDFFMNGGRKFEFTRAEDYK